MPLHLPPKFCCPLELPLSSTTQNAKVEYLGSIKPNGSKFRFTCWWIRWREILKATKSLDNLVDGRCRQTWSFFFGEGYFATPVVCEIHIFFVNVCSSSRAMARRRWTMIHTPDLHSSEISDPDGRSTWHYVVRAPPSSSNSSRS